MHFRMLNSTLNHVIASTTDGSDASVRFRLAIATARAKLTDAQARVDLAHCDYLIATEPGLTHETV